MPEKVIGLIAAMPEEVRPLIRSVEPVTREKLAGFNVYRFRASSKEIVLIGSGIGAARAAQATRLLIDAAAPGVLLNFGFGGAVLPGPSVGDIVVADRLLFFKERFFASQAGLAPALADDPQVVGRCATSLPLERREPVNAMGLSPSVITQVTDCLSAI